MAGHHGKTLPAETLDPGVSLDVEGSFLQTKILGGFASCLGACTYKILSHIFVSLLEALTFLKAFQIS